MVTPGSALISLELQQLKNLWIQRILILLDETHVAPGAVSPKENAKFQPSCSESIKTTYKVGLVLVEFDKDPMNVAISRVQPPFGNDILTEETK